VAASKISAMGTPRSNERDAIRGFAAVRARKRVAAFCLRLRIRQQLDNKQNSLALIAHET
jgi:hypothetical protein